VRKNLNTVIVLAFAMALIILPPAITGRIRMFAATPLRPVGEARRAALSAAASLLNPASPETQKSLADENAALREQVEQLRIQLDTARSQLASYQAFAANRAQNALPEGRTVAASVVFKSGTGQMRHTLYIDRGTLDGVREGMPVVSGGALVGVVNAAGPAMSEVIALGDPRLKVSVFLVPAKAEDANPASPERLAGILVGTANDKVPLRLNYIWRKVAAAKGDYVVTSGYNGAFPRGLIAGTVSGVSERTSDFNHLIEVQPAIGFEEVDQVLVLTDWPVAVPPPNP
jgi:rod shape-determining protein MreC